MPTHLGLAELTAKHSGAIDMKKSIVTILALLSFGHASAQLVDAKVTTKVKDGQCIIYITENVTNSLLPDFQQAVSLLENEVCDEKIVDLNNFGGSGNVAWKVGKIIRDNSFKTQVQAGNYCSSACGLLFIAGTERALEVKRFQSLPKIGFHAPFSKKHNVCESIGEVPKSPASELLFNIMSKYTQSMLDYDASKTFLSLMFHTECKTMVYPNPEKLVEHNIATKIGKFSS